MTRTAAFPLRWHPSGNQLAYFHFEGAIRQILAVDTQKRVPTPAVWDVEGDLSDFAWSPDGQRMAISTDGLLSLVNLGDSHKCNYQLFPKGRIQEIAWSGDGGHLLVTARPEGAEYTQLYEVDASTGRCVLRMATTGDVLKPRWVPGGTDFVYHVSFQGMTTALRGGQFPARTLTLISGASNASWEVQGFNPSGQRMIILSRPFSQPPSLLEAPCGGLSSTLIYPDRDRTRVLSPGPASVSFPSSEGVSVPALLWRAAGQENAPKAVLIEVHGGPHLHAGAEWDAGRALLLAQGWTILAVDYRGSTGHGATFENMNDLNGQIQDVLAARDYALQHLGAAREQLIFLGSSYGAFLAACACSRAPDSIGGAILLSMPNLDFPQVSNRRAPRVLYGFHGQNDDVISPKAARLAIERLFGAQSLRQPNGRWEVLKDEGHQFHRTLSWAKIYTAIINLKEKH
jgi:dipeptidyl aminopeptidase/acylaminoacyl peptidase